MRIYIFDRFCWLCQKKRCAAFVCVKQNEAERCWSLAYFEKGKKGLIPNKEYLTKRMKCIGLWLGIIWHRDKFESKSLSFSVRLRHDISERSISSFKHPYPPEGRVWITRMLLSKGMTFSSYLTSYAFCLLVGRKGIATTLS